MLTRIAGVRIFFALNKVSREHQFGPSRATNTTRRHPLRFVCRRKYKTEQNMNTRQSLRNLAWSLIRQAQLLKRGGQLDLAKSLTSRGLTLKAYAWAMTPEPIPIRNNNRRG